MRAVILASLIAATVAFGQEVPSECTTDYLLARQGSTHLNFEAINGILTSHNEARRRVTPYASIMPMLQWDENLATFAQEIANTCNPNHTTSPQRSNATRFSGFGYVGENLAQYTSSGDVDQSKGSYATDLWNGEIEFWHYPTCSPNQVCGHYTQNIWAATTKIGCGAYNCMINQKQWTMWRCIYGSGGNYVGQNPYREASSLEGSATCTFNRSLATTTHATTNGTTNGTTAPATTTAKPSGNSTYTTTTTAGGTTGGNGTTDAPSTTAAGTGDTTTHTTTTAKPSGNSTTTTTPHTTTAGDNGDTTTARTTTTAAGGNGDTTTAHTTTGAGGNGDTTTAHTTTAANDNGDTTTARTTTTAAGGNGDTTTAHTTTAAGGNGDTTTAHTTTGANDNGDTTTARTTTKPAGGGGGQITDGTPSTTSPHTTTTTHTSSTPTSTTTTHPPRPTIKFKFQQGSNATASTLRAEIAKLLNISIDNLFIVPVAESSSSTGTTNEVEIAFTFEADANGALVEADAGNLGSAGVYSAARVDTAPVDEEPEDDDSTTTIIIASTVAGVVLVGGLSFLAYRVISSRANSLGHMKVENENQMDQELL